MTSYQNILIDGTVYGAEVVRQRRRWRDAAAASEMPGLPGVAPGTPGVPGRQGSVSSPPDSAPALTAHRLREESEAKAAAENYEKGVLDMLGEIRRRASGRALLAEIRRIGHRLTIIPHIPLDQKRWWDASAWAEDIEDATRKHRLVRDWEAEPITREKTNIRGETTHRHVRGTGAGTDCGIRYITPDLARVFSQTPVATASPGREEKAPASLKKADEILVHELVHAMRGMAGLNVRRRVPGQKDYDNVEEFYAMVVTNVFRSEVGRPGVRNDNHGDFLLMHVSGKHFLQLHFNRLHLRRFCNQHPIFARELGAIQAYFNPFQDMLT